MSQWEQSFKTLMPLAVATGMAAAMDSMTRALVGPKLEKKLGRSLTEWDWRVYREEQAIKQICLAWVSTFIQCCHQLMDKERIREFVWEDGG
jgi:hypothetical protein